VARVGCSGLLGASEILWLQSRMLRDAGEHLRADFVTIMKGLDVVRPPSA
jgi:hypothetical protein